MFDPLEQPALAYILQQQLWARRGNQILIASGMGIVPQLLAHSEQELELMEARLMQARSQEYKTWRGFDVRHLLRQQSGNFEYRQFDVFSALDVATPALNQATFDFLTLRDRQGAKLETSLNAQVYKPDSDIITTFLQADEDEIRLAMAFRREMVNEAAPHRHDIASGAYVLMRETLPKLDTRLIYDHLRLLIVPQGIGVAVVHDSLYIPFWWSPENDTNTSQVWVPADIRFAFDVLLASIWRDACIVRERFVQECRDKGKGYQGKQAFKSDVVRLPRVIFKSQWGSNMDRQITEGISKRAHTVRGHYRLISDEYIAPDEQKEAALDYGIPAPPVGYTFVRPHSRGTGEALPVARRVICQGLQVARTVLS